ncbi:MAG: M48 family metalloprotease [Pseudomonadaceae bacterium]|nr:M48 family metalloprotease [Pseudomonadaceae bacterium]
MSAANNAEKVRCASDREMSERLLKDRTVIRVNEKIARAENDGPLGIRRRLLATSVRLSERMAPSVHRHATECGDMLGLGIPLEVYVYSSPQYNAACFKPEDGRLFIMFSSSLLEAFDDSELRFVMGHELGHHVYRHHEVPIGYILKGGRPDPRLALELFTWSRYAEISADRAGAYCAQDIVGVSRALFKLASGLSGSSITFSMEDFLAQVDQMQIEDAEPGQGAPKEDWFSTHPFSPLRVKALKLFDESELMSGAASVEDLEVGVQGVLSLMEPSYLEGRTDTAEAMRRLLFAGSLLVANADGHISDAEIALFEQFFGQNTFDADKLNLEALNAELAPRISAVRENASTPQAMQVVRDLCVIARAEDHTSDAERAVLDTIADGLEVPRAFICQAMDSDVEPD